MAQVFDPSSGQWIEVPDDEVTALVGAGKAFLPKGKVSVVDARGVAGEVPAEDAPQAFANGYRYRPAAEIQAEQERERYADRPLAAGIAGAARGITLGLSDVAATKSGLVAPETLKGLEDYNEEASVGGEVLGTGAALLATAGAATPVALADRLGTRLGVAAAERLGAGGLVRGAVKGGVEGGLYGLGRAITDDAQRRDPLTAEKAMASTMGGALFGAGAGALFGRLGDKAGGRASGAVDDAAPTPASILDDEVTQADTVVTGGAVPGTAGNQRNQFREPQGTSGTGTTPPDGGAAGAIAAGTLSAAKPIKDAIEANPGVFRRVFSALDISMPDADEFVLRGLDVKKKGAALLREKGLEKSAPAALRSDPRFAQVKNGEDAARLIRTKLEESGGEVQAAAARLDEMVSPSEQLDVAAFAARAEQELVAPLARGTVDERRAAARIREELAAMLDGVPETPATLPPRKAGVVVDVPLSELDDIPAKANRNGALANVLKGLDEGKDLGAIKVVQGADGLRELADGNHRLVAARQRGAKSIKVLFDSEEAAAIAQRKRGSSVFPDAQAPMDAPGWKPAPPPAGRQLLTFAQAEDLKRRLDKSLRWDSTTPNEVREQLRQLRGLLNRTQEETAERVSKTLGKDTFAEWKRAKALYGQMAELDNIATERLGDAKNANRLFSLTDNLAGAAGFAVGGGLNPVGLALSLGSALLNKWGRENLPFVMARAMGEFDGNPGARKAAQALINRLKGSGPDAGAAPVAPIPPAPAGPGGAGATPTAAIHGALLSMLQRAAQAGPREAWVAHAILSGSTEYRQALEARGLAQYTPEADAEGSRRAATASRVEKAAAAFDARADAAAKGLFSGKRGKVTPTEGPKALAKAEQVRRAAQEPETVVTRVAERLADVGVDTPGLASEMQATAQRAHAFLASKAPARPASPLGDVPALRLPWKPSAAEMAKWAAYVRAVEDPASVLEDAAGGRLTPEGVEALSAVYPSLLADLRGRVLGMVAEHPRRLDYQQRLSLGLLLGLDLDESMTPAVVASLQQMHQQQPEKPQGRPEASSRTQKRLQSEFSPADGLSQRSV
jgi:hypothetical protein